MPYLFLDIETAPLEIKNEAIKSYLMDKKISKESRSFIPIYSKIITIGIKELDKPAEIYADDNEKALLEKFWQIINKNPFSRIVTFNGYKFDIPFIIIRSIINEVNMPIHINTNRWSMEKSNHFDVMMFFSQYETFLNPSLEVMGHVLGIPAEYNSISGADIERLYKEGNIDEIKNKCQNDVVLLEEVFKRVCMSYLESKNKL